MNTLNSEDVTFLSGIALLGFVVIEVMGIVFFDSCLEREVKREALAKGMNPYMTVKVDQSN